MKNFVAVYFSPAMNVEQMSSITEEQRNQVMAAWMAWKEKVGNTVVDFGAPLMGGQRLTPGNGWAPSNAEISGYSLLQGESLEAVQALCADHPHLGTPEAAIEIHEAVAM